MSQACVLPGDDPVLRSFAVLDCPSQRTASSHDTEGRKARGLVAAVFLGLALAVLSIGYLHVIAAGLIDPARHPISDYAAMPGGPALLAAGMTGLIVAGVALVLALRAQPSNGAICVLLVSWCAALAIAAVFPTNPPGNHADGVALAHRYAAAWMMASLPVAGWWLATRFAHAPSSRSSSVHLRLLSALSGGASAAFQLAHELGAALPFPGMGLLQRGLLALQIAVLACAAVAIHRASHVDLAPGNRYHNRRPS